MTEDEFQMHVGAIIGALRDGEIQENNLGEWGPPTQESILLGDTDLEYRIAPKPLECWVCFNTDGSIRHADIKGATATSLAPYVHMREVTE